MKIQKCRKKSHHFLTLWPWPLTYDLEKLIRSGHYHYQCVYQIWEQSILWFFSYRVNTIAGGGRLWRKTITSPDPSDTGDITMTDHNWHIDTWAKRPAFFSHGLANTYNFINNIGSCNGSLPDGIRPLPEPMLTYHQSVQWHSITKLSSKMTYLKFHLTPSGTNELIPHIPASLVSHSVLITLLSL